MYELRILEGEELKNTTLNQLNTEMQQTGKACIIKNYADKTIVLTIFREATSCAQSPYYHPECAKLPFGKCIYDKEGEGV